MSGKPGQEGEGSIGAGESSPDPAIEPDTPEPRASAGTPEAIPESPVSNERLIGRFEGNAGHRRLKRQLLENSLVRGDERVADSLLNVTSLLEAMPGDVIISQGASDNDLFLVISGNLSVEVNGREVAQRTSGSHFGEMSLVDAAARRAATVTATDHVVLAKVSEAEFEDIAAAHPELWRRVAIEISRRLQERSRLLRPPRERPVVFLGCSKEFLHIAQEIQVCLQHDPYVIDIWTDGVFNASSTPIEDLDAKIRNIDFGVMLATPDDFVDARGQGEFSPRDNVILELGLLIGALGRKRVLLLVPLGIELRLPSDLLGVNPITYSADEAVPLRSRIAPSCTELRAVFARLGPL